MSDLSFEAPPGSTAPSRTPPRRLPAAFHGAGAVLVAGRGDARRLASGWAARARIGADGKPQVLSFLLPGDLWRPGRFGEVAGVATVALTDVMVSEPRPAAGLEAELTAAEAAEDRALLDHVVRLGRLTASERVAHLLLELRARLRRRGLADLRQMPLPLTQGALAAALGLSSVHLNRTLAQLKQEGFLRLQRGRVDFLRLADWPGLCAALPPEGSLSAPA